MNEIAKINTNSTGIIRTIIRKIQTTQPDSFKFLTTERIL